MKYQRLRGMRDIDGDEAAVVSFIQETASRVARVYNYSEVILPTIEESELFTRAAGATSDIIEKQMYVFKDKGERTVALRPEGTAGAARYYVQSAMPAIAQKGIPFVKIFYRGSMFRYERPQAGRYREFIQWGAEYFGNPEPLCDTEVISLLDAILEKCGLDERTLDINSLGCARCRPSYVSALKEFADGISDTLCEDCKRRLVSNPLRILDCKIDSPKISSSKNFPRAIDFLCQDCSRHYDSVKKNLDASGIKYSENHLLVRGLDYYTRTVFEIKSAFSGGAQDAVAAGGRYDNLIEEIGGKPTPAAGFAIGVERLAGAIINKSGGVSVLEKIKSTLQGESGYFIAVTSDGLISDAAALAATLRKNGIIAEGPIGNGKSLKNQLSVASRLNFEKTLILADEEFKSREEILVKDMATGNQQPVGLKNLIAELIQKKSSQKQGE